MMSQQGYAPSSDNPTNYQQQPPSQATTQQQAPAAAGATQAPSSGQNGNQMMWEPYWNEEEHSRFLNAIERQRPPYDWNLLAAYVGTRNAQQVQTHSHLYFMCLQRRLPFAAAMGSAYRLTARDMYQDMAYGNRGNVQNPPNFSNPEQQRQYQQQMMQYQQMQQRSAQPGSGGRGGVNRLNVARPGKRGREDPPQGRGAMSMDFLCSRDGDGKKQATDGKKVQQPMKPVPTPTPIEFCGEPVEQSELDAELEESLARGKTEKEFLADDAPNRWEWVRRKILGPRSYQFWFPIFRELIPLSKKEVSDDIRVFKACPELEAAVEENRKEKGKRSKQQSSQQNQLVLDDEDDDPDNDKWVQCDRCHKWRRLPMSVDMRDIQKQRRWFCEMNPDKKRARCSIAEPKAVAPPQGAGNSARRSAPGSRSKASR